MELPLAFLGIVSVAFLYWGVGVYNGLISMKNQIERAWANIDVILKQRFDEIPKIVQVLEQMANFEAGILTSLAKARTHYGQAKTVHDKIGASNEMTRALTGLLAVIENYPDLKTNGNFSQLQSRVTQLESTLADRRETYNDAVTNFNTRIEQFPDLILAGMMRYVAKELFEVSEDEKAQPSLKMNLPNFKREA